MGVRSDRETRQRGSAAAEALFLAQQPLIRRAVRHVVRRWSLREDEAADLQSDAQLKLVQNDYAVLRQFQGKSSLEAYLVTVISRVFFDSRIRRFGKWRPSAEAVRRGPLAEEAERLVCHDGRTLDEAAVMLSLRRNEPITRDDIADLLSHLPVRRPRSEPHDCDPDSVPATDPGPDDAVRIGDARTMAARVHAHLSAAIDGLEPDDRLLMKLYYVDELTVARIARLLGVEQRPMYRTIERCLGEMRRYLESKGVVSESVDEVVGSSEVLIKPVKIFRHHGETRPAGPSKKEGGGPEASSLRGEVR
jgi:RNA polymerase sigma factor for flagellar operon FliA